MKSRLAEKNPLVSIIIPVYNGKDYIKNCLKNIFKNTQRPTYEVIVVDDASKDGSKEYLRSLKKVKLIENKQNLRFAKTCNRGASIATGKYLHFLNMDTIPLPHWLEEMVKLIERDKKIAVVGSKLIYPGINRIQHAGVVFGKKKLPYHIYQFAPPTIKAVNKVKEFTSVTGASMLIRKEIFSKVEGFCEKYFCEYEDIDLCLKVKEEGYKIFYCPKSVLFHYESVVRDVDEIKKRSKNLQFFSRRWKEKIKIDDYKYYREAGYDLDLISSLRKKLGLHFFMGIESNSDCRRKFKTKKDYQDFEDKIYKNAIKNFEKALSFSFKASTKIILLYALGSFYQKKNLFDKAAKKFNDVIKLSKKIFKEKGDKFKGNAFFHLGQIYQMQNNNKEAKHCFKNCLPLITNLEKIKETNKILKFL